MSQAVRGNSREGCHAEEKRHAVTDSFALQVTCPTDQSRLIVRASPRFVFGNHETKHLQSNLQSTHKKHFNAAAILGRPQSELLGDDAFLGR